MTKPKKRTAKRPKRDAAQEQESMAQVRLRDLTSLVFRAARHAGVTTGVHQDYLDATMTLETLSRVCSAALQTAREQAVEIERLKLAVDASTSGTIDQALLALLGPHCTSKNFGNDDVARHAVVLTCSLGGAISATLCVARDATVLPYRRARRGSDKVHEALASLIYDIDPHLDITGMCDGLRKLHERSCPTCRGALRDLGGDTDPSEFTACDPCGKVWSRSDMSLVSAPRPVEADS